MAQLTYTITATQAEFNNFADRLGYMPTLIINDVPTPNPETRTEFITRLMKDAQDTLFYTPFVREIDQQVLDERAAEKEVMRNNIRSRSTINFVP